MTELPSGTVTLLFSDMEGSTRLLRQLGSEYATVLHVQRELLRQAWAEYGGTELGTEGDSFYVVFTSPHDAIAAAVKGQRDLAVAEFVAGVRPSVRIGIHTGNPIPHEGAYVGLDVHRAARISAAAHGGQIVVSAATSALMQGHDDADVDLVDLGSHQLKDVPRPEHLYQVVADGLDSHFPPLRTVGTVTGLPTAATPLVGRDEEVNELARLVGSKSASLVTLTGVGGSGKTRLATAVAEYVAASYSDGVYFVPLATVTGQDVMWTSIAGVMSLPEAAKAPAAILESIAERNCLVVLDNLEQLDGADAVVAELFAGTTSMSILATSRRPLHLRGEHEHPVPGLTLPTNTDRISLEHSGAVALFVQQAAFVKPSFALTGDNAGSVVEVCRRLDGIPLGIELAAARSKVLSPQALAARIDESLDLTLQGVDRPERQQTLRATIQWSYDLLTPVQQRFFEYLGIFVGGADLPAIAAVIPAAEIGEGDILDLLTDLADVSLVTITEGDDHEPRALLLETIGAYATERLESAGLLEIARRRHAFYYRDLARGDRDSRATAQRVMARGVETQKPWFEANLDNLRRALTWALPDDHEVAPDEERLEAGFALLPFVYWGILIDGYLREGELWANRTLHWAGSRRTEEVATCYVAGSHAAQQVGANGIALARAQRAYQLATSSDNDDLHARATLALAYMLVDAGHTDEALALSESRLDRTRAAGNDSLHCHALASQSVLLAVSGREAEALEMEREALELAIKVGDSDFALILRQNIGCSLRILGRLDEAWNQFEQIVGPIISRGYVGSMCTFGEDVACLLSELGDSAGAARLLGSVDTHRAEVGAARAALQADEIRGPVDKARRELGAAWQSHYARGAGEPLAEVLKVLVDAGPPRPTDR